MTTPTVLTEYGTYPTEINMEHKHYPVKTVAFSGKDVDTEMTARMLWSAQQRVFDAKRDIMRLMFEEGYVPVDEGFDTEIVVEVKCYVKRRCVDGEATDNQWITLPVNMNYLTVAKPLDIPIYSSVD